MNENEKATVAYEWWKEREGKGLDVYRKRIRFETVPPLVALGSCDTHTLVIGRHHPQIHKLSIHPKIHSDPHAPINASHHPSILFFLVFSTSCFHGTSRFTHSLTSHPLFTSFDLLAVSRGPSLKRSRYSHRRHLLIWLL